MPIKPLKPCSIPNCPELTQNKYCDKHQEKAAEIKRDNNKAYDMYRRNQKARDFYHSKAWTKTRQAVLVRDHFLCQMCLDNKVIQTGDLVHHKVELLDGEEGWKRRLDMSNLVTVCHDCHNRIHSKS